MTYNSSWVLFVISFILVLSYSLTNGKDLKTSDVLIRYGVVHVPFGRTTNLDPNKDLKLKVRQGDLCSVLVLENDPLSERPGKMTPRQFPCNFTLGDVKYEHFGARNPSHDRVHLQIRYDSETQTLIIPVTLEMDVTFIQLEVVTKNRPIDVQRAGQLSDPINSRKLEFTYDRATEDCRVSVLSGSRRRPKYGHVVSRGDTLRSRDCDDFLLGEYRYQHIGNESTPDRDYIPMFAEIFTKDDGVKQRQEHFHMMVRIRDAEFNKAPRFNPTATLILEVNQFVMTAITPDMLSATDAETDSDSIIFNISQPLKLGEGYIVSTDDQNIPMKAFYQKDVKDLKVAYRPPSQDSNVQRVFNLGLTAIDSEGEKSDQAYLVIIVNPMNTLAPLVTRNTGIQLIEGQSRPLVSSVNLEIADEDNLQNVRVSVIDGLRHGRLIIPSRRTYFTAKDLDAATVRYQHDHSDTTSDNIIFRMTDGLHDVHFLFPVTIYPLDDEAPILTKNLGLLVENLNEVRLDPSILTATDVDSDDELILFTIADHRRGQGVIIQRQIETPGNLTGWSRRDDGQFENVVTEWTQGNINEGRVYYRHTAGQLQRVGLDRIKFSLKDTADPPNFSSIKHLIVKIFPRDSIPPVKAEDSPNHMNVKESELTPLSRLVLRYTDVGSQDRALRYLVRHPPYVSNGAGVVPDGKLVHCDDPSREVTEFTQAEINHLKICYLPNEEELGLTMKGVKFEFSVSDTSGNEIHNQQFHIAIEPVDNQAPTITHRNIQLKEHSTYALSPNDLFATDADTDPQNIKFIIEKLSLYGNLNKNGHKIIEGQEFSLRDITHGAMEYEHKNGSDNHSGDSFKLQVSDLTNSVSVKMQVNIIAMDDSKEPSPDIPNGRLNTVIQVPESGEVVLTMSSLGLGLFADVKDTRRTLFIDRQPQYGTILVDSIPVRDFTIDHVKDGIVTYRHLVQEIGPYAVDDVFNISIAESDWVIAGKRILGIDVRVKVQPTNNQAPNATIRARLYVNEAGKAPIVQTNIYIEDMDTDASDIVCNMKTQPEFGFIENMSPAPGSEKPRNGTPINVFTFEDIILEHLNYVQSIHKGMEPTEDQFVLECTDGINRGPPVSFPILILPINDEYPVIHAREFIVEEGGNLLLDLPLLMATDDDVPPDLLTFLIIKPPIHGTIVRQTASESTYITTFTLNDLQSSVTILYEHDDTETTNDTLTLGVTDGNHNVTMDIVIIVIPVDDETPRLTVNVGLEIKPEEGHVITPDDLKATDIDSPDVNLTYVIRKVPSYGFLQFIKGDQFGNLSRGMTFQQHHINSGNIRYIHTGRDGVRDLIKFDITDGFNPLIDRYFYVTIEAVDRHFPEVINKGVQLPEGGSVVLTTNMLSTADPGSMSDLTLEFRITRPPTLGRLELVDQPGVPVFHFTQLDLASNKIRYVHTSENEDKMDSFELEVTDGRNPVFRTFQITLTDVDNKQPVLIFDPITARQGSQKLITPFELRAEDVDTRDALIRFNVTWPPRYGRLVYNSSTTVQSFTMEDLNSNLISYIHDGSVNLEDSFYIKVTDGTHDTFYIHTNLRPASRLPVKIPITITAVDKNFPQVLRNRGLNYIHNIRNQTGAQISSSVLKATDRDSLDDRLTFTLLRSPTVGYIAKEGDLGSQITSWSQGDIDEGNIYYILRYKTSVFSDSFVFQVSDGGNNKAEAQVFDITWSWVSMSMNFYETEETDREVHVSIKRRGNLDQTAFVSLEIQPGGSAKINEDFTLGYTNQVQFNPGEERKNFTLYIVDDSDLEGDEDMTLTLTNGVMTLIEAPNVSRIRITDNEDRPSVIFNTSHVEVSEDTGEVTLTIIRLGDPTNDLAFTCYTEDGSARGSSPYQLTSFSDYVFRPQDSPRSLVRMLPGQTISQCQVTIIADALLEPDETFKVLLGGHQVGNVSEVEVTIKADKKDGPVFSFASPEYHVDESSGHVIVTIRRTGSDLSMISQVTVRSKRTDTPSASANEDYAPEHSMLTFDPEVTSKTLKVTILDDNGYPILEGTEKFQLVLQMPMNGSIGQQNVTSITINDTVTDRPSFEFKIRQAVVSEDSSALHVTILRHGDASNTGSVRCFTRQDSASVTMDYVERPNTDESRVEFQPGETEQTCKLTVIADGFHEGNETMLLVLGSPEDEVHLAKIGDLDRMFIMITDSGDETTIGFLTGRVSVGEPKVPSQRTSVSLTVVRRGDVSSTSVVGVYTRDSSTATSGVDYIGISTEIRFDVGVRFKTVSVEVLFDGVMEVREAFTVRLRQLPNTNAKIINDRAIVIIEETDQLSDVTFPTHPIIISLRHYADITKAPARPFAGYPLVCVTACDSAHPSYPETQRLCQREGLNQSLTRFRWLVGDPVSGSSHVPRLKVLTHNTVFTSTTRITLDSIYFSSGSRVHCVARAVSNSGDPGLESSSDIIIIGDKGICEGASHSAIGAPPYGASLQYIGPKDDEHPNSIRISIRIPHRDGLFPILSTHVLSNFDLTVSQSSFRLGLHQCSNLLDDGEGGHFINDPSNATGTAKPFYYSESLRGKDSVSFYRNLNLESCVWQFKGFFNMSELLTKCGGSVTKNGQIQDLLRSVTTITVPLYVSYLHHSQQMRTGWRHVDFHSELQISFIYNTAILWNDGIDTSEQSAVKGRLFPVSMKISRDGHLDVAFKTKAFFNGQFILSHGSRQSSVANGNRPDLTFNLTLQQSDSSYDQPEQIWKFRSKYAVPDYSGIYKISLIPCRASISQRYSNSRHCNPVEKVHFNLNVRFQQVNDPVPSEFTLNTKFSVTKKMSNWLSGRIANDNMDMVFRPDDTIYGLVETNSHQNLGEAFPIAIQKVYICSGKKGYIPTFEPANNLYGCLDSSRTLLSHSLRILDKNAAETEEKFLQGKPLDAALAKDDPMARPLVEMSHADGFRFNAKPLFKVDNSHQWSIHIIYSIYADDKLTARLKRDVYHSLSDISTFNKSSHQLDNYRSRQDIGNITFGGDSGKGTNMIHLQLESDAVAHSALSAAHSGDTLSVNKSTFASVASIISILILLFAVFVLVVLFKKHKK